NHRSLNSKAKSQAEQNATVAWRRRSSRRGRSPRGVTYTSESVSAVVSIVNVPRQSGHVGIVVVVVVMSQAPVAGAVVASVVAAFAAFVGRSAAATFARTAFHVVPRLPFVVVARLPFAGVVAV